MKPNRDWNRCIVILCFALIILTSNVSGFEFDNIKRYDYETKTITITNALGLGDKIADIRLKTPHLYGVPSRQDIKVAELEFNNIENYVNVFNDMKFYDTQGRELTKQFTYKYLDTVEVESSWQDNETKLLYKSYSNKNVWKDLDSVKGLEKGVHTIGIFTDVVEGEMVEWIPTLYGREITEWAWFSGLTNFEWYNGSDDNHEEIHGGVNTDAGATTAQMGGVSGSSETMINITVINILTEIEGAGSGNCAISMGNLTADVPGEPDENGVNISYGNFPASDIGAKGWHQINMTSAAPVDANADQNVSIMLICEGGDLTNNIHWFIERGGSPYAYGSAWANYGGGWTQPADYAASSFLFEIWGKVWVTDDPPNVTMLSPLNNTNHSNNNITFNCSATDDNVVENVSLWINGAINYTETGGTYNNLSLNTTINLFSDGAYTWYCNATDDNNVDDVGGTRNFTVDTTDPATTITFPSNISYAGNITEFNFTFSDTNIESCWWSNDSGITNQSLTLGNNVTGANVTDGNNIWTAYCNDSAGNLNWSSITFVMHLFDYVQTTDENPTIDMATPTYTLNLSMTGIPATTAFLIHNFTRYNATTVNAYTDSYYFSRQITIPSGTGNATGINATWNWTFDFSGLTETYNTTDIENQTVYNLSMDDCSTHGTLVLNYTLQDEENQYILNGPSIESLTEVDLQLYPMDSDVMMVNYSNNYTQLNNSLVCINLNLNGTSLRMFVQTRYDGSNYSAEYHHIQNFTVTNTTTPTIPLVITLYDLLDGDSQQFLITYKDSTFLPVEDALIDIQRKYVSEGVFKSVEIPKTDEQGQTTGHFDLDNVVYTIVVSKWGRVLATFDNIAVVCQDLVIEDCRINLNALATGIDFDDWEEAGGITYTMSFDDATKTITTVFTSTDGSTKDVVLNSTKYDRFGNETICFDELSSSSGTLTCTVPDSFGNVTTIVELTSDETLVTRAIFSVDPDPTEFFGVDGIIMVLILVITIPLMFVDSPIGIVIGVVVGLVMSAMLMLYDGGSALGATSVVMWAIISGGIIIWKITSGGRD